MAEDLLIVGVYRMTITPALTRLKASSVPTEMALDRLSRLMKKAKQAVKMPVTSVPIRGISVDLVVHLKKGNSRPYTTHTPNITTQ